MQETDLADLAELVKAGEYRVALELLWNQLYEYGSVIDQQVFRTISECAAVVDIPPEEFDFLRELIRA